MNLIRFGLALLSLFGCLAASSYPVEGPEMFESKSKSELEEIVKELMGQVDIESNFRRDKKYGSNNQPLLNHRRKSDPNEPNCKTHMTLFESNRMIDSKKSINNGAKFLGVEKINPSLEFSLKELQDSCVNMCCSNNLCDTAMLSLTHGQNGYRCYMFQCSQHCLFIKHKDYALLRQKSPEQEQVQDNKLQTGHKNNINCHKQYEFTCLKIKQCIPIYDVCDSMPHCEDKTDELNCDSNRTSTSVQEKTTSKAPVDFYEFDEDYEQDLLRQQSEILEHLKLLESQQSSDRFYHPKNFLEKFMQEEEESLRLRKKTTTRRLTKPSTLRPLFHDMGTGSLKDMSNFWNEKKEEKESHFRFEDDENKIIATKSDNVQAVIILIVGCVLVTSFFVYIALSTKYVSKKLRIMNLLGKKGAKSSAQNVDVDGDYLINGLYL